MSSSASAELPVTKYSARYRRSCTSRKKLFEARRIRGRLTFPVELDDVVLGLHATMDARRIPIV